jgi:hypothetical protein
MKGPSLQSGGTVSADQALLVRAEGLIYSIVVETEQDPLDWLDRVLLDLTQEAQPIEELFGAFALPTRFLENAISKLLEGKYLLLNVHDGTLRASQLEPQLARGRELSLEVWQDHATGMLLPAEQVKPWAAGRKQGGSSAATPILRGEKPPRTPLEMSDAELLHRLIRFRPELARKAIIRKRERTRRMALEVKAQHHPGGRLAIKDAVPWPLRASWARLPDVAAPGESNGSVQQSLPPRWEEAVGSWFQELYERTRGLAETEGALNRLLPLLEAAPGAELTANGVVAAKRLAREAESSLVLAISAGHGTPGEAVQILQESSIPKRILVLSGLEAKPDKAGEWKEQGITILSTHAQAGPDFLLVDGRVVAFGGINPSAAKVFTIRARTALGGYVSWLAEQGVQLPSLAADPDELAGELRALESDVRDMVGSRHRRKPDGEDGLDDETRLQTVQEHLKERGEQLRTRLLAKSLSPLAWIPPAEVLTLVEEWSGPMRVLVRDPASALAKTAMSRGVECVLWPKGNAPADCVVADRVVLLGFSLEGVVFSIPEFLAIHDAEFASQIRMETYNFLQLSSS